MRERTVSLVRYALFLEMFAKLSQAQNSGTSQQTTLRRMVLDIADSEEEFLGRERGLKCLDGGIRKIVMDRLKRVRNNEEKAGVEIYLEMYSRVLDKVNQLLGVYQNVKLNKE